MEKKIDKILAVRTSKTIYRDVTTVVKLFDSGYSKSDILNEALNQARVEETGLNIPKLLEVGIIDGQWALRTEFISGKTLKRLMDEEPDKRDYYLNMFVDLQMSVHSKQSPMRGKLKDKMERKIMQSDLPSEIRYELRTAVEGMPKHTKVCHGDFNPSNVIISEDGTPYIIDWSHATQGNASADVARTYLLFCLDGDRDTADKYLDLFCAKSNTLKRYIQKWLPVVAASQSVKGNANEREFLLSWVNVVDYE